MTDDVLLPAGKEWPSRGEGAFSRMHVDGRPTIRCPRMLIITHDASPLQPPITSSEPWMFGLRAPTAAAADPAPEEQRKATEDRPAGGNKRPGVIDAEDGKTPKRQAIA